MDGATWLPIAFALLMGASILAYVILDGYDLGVGILMADATPEERDTMIASIGPFWDANETWLVLAVGLLLVAFPIAHGMILTALYLPVAVLLLALIARGVAFEFRAKVPTHQKRAWNHAFIAGSTIAALAQGFMLGMYIMGLTWTWPHVAFAILTAVCIAAGYGFVGATWLILKTEKRLQQKAVRWARLSLGLVAIGMIAVSLATPLVSPRIFEKWFRFPEIILLAPIPLMTAATFAGLSVLLGRLPARDDRWAWVPFAGAIGLFVLGFAGLAYSFWPYVVPEQITIFQAAAAPASLLIIFVGTCVVLPMIIAYSAFAYWVFRGKATALKYD
jgi:cytochrome d ubiquinol oxidase subunit II